MYANAELYMRVDHTRNYGDDHPQLYFEPGDPLCFDSQETYTRCG